MFPLSLILFSYLPFLGILFLGYWQLGYLKKEWRSNFLIYSLTIPYLMGISIFLRMDMLMTFFITLVDVYKRNPNDRFDFSRCRDAHDVIFMNKVTELPFDEIKDKSIIEIRDMVEKLNG